MKLQIRIKLTRVGVRYGEIVSDPVIYEKYFQYDARMRQEFIDKLRQEQFIVMGVMESDVNEFLLGHARVANAIPDIINLVTHNKHYGRVESDCDMSDNYRLEVFVYEDVKPQSAAVRSTSFFRSAMEYIKCALK
ncbi:hypothetical protein DEEACLCL_00107 [Salmonella phage CRW-SP2]|nr:hypothetical protein DEEACLCL_00107 [Salmonella phage CRW-SP2]